MSRQPCHVSHVFPGPHESMSLSAALFMDTASPRRPTSCLQWALVPVAIAVPWAIFAASALWPSGPDDGASVEARPPPAVFGVMWTLIVLCLSGAWVWTILAEPGLGETAVTGSVFVGLVALGVVWQYVYHTRGVKQGAWVLWAFVLMALAVYTMVANVHWGAALLIVPALAWSLYAGVMNVVEAGHALPPATETAAADIEDAV